MLWEGGERELAPYPIDAPCSWVSAWRSPEGEGHPQSVAAWARDQAQRGLVDEIVRHCVKVNHLETDIRRFSSQLELFHNEFGGIARPVIATAQALLGETAEAPVDYAHQMLRNHWGPALIAAHLLVKPFLRLEHVRTR